MMNETVTEHDVTSDYYLRSIKTRLDDALEAKKLRADFSDYDDDFATDEKFLDDDYTDTEDTADLDDL
jgi:hypothetical protein